MLRHDELQARIRDVAAGSITLREALDSDPLLAQAHRRLAAYADRLVLVTGSGAHTDVNAILTWSGSTRASPLPCSSTTCRRSRSSRRSPGGRARRAGHRGSQAAGPRPEAGGDRHRRRRPGRASTPGVCTCGTSAARRRSPTRPTPSSCSTRSWTSCRGRTSRTRRPRAEEFHRQVVFSIEKNRNGSQDIHLEFEKDFGHYRFNPRGRRVADRLWTEGSGEL